MRQIVSFLVLHLLLSLTCHRALVYAQAIVDWRNIANGYIIPDEGYSDQPFIVKTDDGAWLCVMTTGKGHEGATGQHVISLRSTDQGKTWIDQRDVEPANGPEASYAVLLKAPSGRIFVFYNHNTENRRHVIGDNPPYKDGIVKRVDSQGHFVFKYSDDNGRSWSSTRIDIPMRRFEIDRKNPYKGDLLYFWNVGKAFSHENTAYVPIHKVGGFGEGFFTSSEGALLKSTDLFFVKDPAKATWNTLPDGDIGLRTPIGGGPVAEEQNFVVLSDGSFYCVYRTVDGYPVYTYSRDKGHTWDPPRYMTYADGRKIKHPRAANFVWKCENGKYLYWFHNHGGKFLSEDPKRSSTGYNDRNPAWLLGGIERDTPNGKELVWSEPEILLYDEDPMIRMSYPDLLEENGKYFVTETQKDVARIHTIENDLLDKLWGQFDTTVRKTSIIPMIKWSDEIGKFPQKTKALSLHDFSIRDYKSGDFRSKNMNTGFTIDLEFTLEKWSGGQIMVDAKSIEGRGWYIRTAYNKTIEIVLNDGRTESVWACDEGLLELNKKHYVSIIIDGGPRIISFVVDGKFNDGGESRQFGWGRFHPYLQTVTGAKEIEIGKGLTAKMKSLRIYDRALKISDVISNYRSSL